MKRMLREQRPVPKRPYRDSIVIFGVLAALLPLIVFLTGGSIVRGVIAGVAFFVAATAWSWWRWSVRIRKERERGARVS